MDLYGALPRLRSFLFLLIHRQHALGHKEAAENVHRGESQGDEAERTRPQRAVIVGDQRDADREQRADHDDRGDGVGHRHQRRVQRRRHRPDHVIADEHREHEDRQPEHERVNDVARRMCRAAAYGGEIELGQDRERYHPQSPSFPSPCGEGWGWGSRGGGRASTSVTYLTTPPPPSPQGGGSRNYAALFGWKLGCTMAPSRVSAVALTMSSSQLTASALVFLSI